MCGGRAWSKTDRCRTSDFAPRNSVTMQTNLNDAYSNSHARPSHASNTKRYA
jgi:hypothetical protein